MAGRVRGTWRLASNGLPVASRFALGLLGTYLDPRITRADAATSGHVEVERIDLFVSDLSPERVLRRVAELLVR